MRVVVTFDTRLLRAPDGAIWTDGAFLYQFWLRYLDVFDSVCLAARVIDVDTVPPVARRLDGAGVTVAALPFFGGPWQFLRQRRRLLRILRSVLNPDDAIILRVPATISTCMAQVAREQQRPYAVEVVGDPYNTFAPGGVRSKLRPFLRWWYPRQLRRQCGEAIAAAYVTASTLQRRYPPESNAYTTYYSSVELRSDAFVESARQFAGAPRPLRLVFVGSLAQTHKGVDVLLEAVALCVARGCEITLNIVGDGQLRPQLEALAEQRALAARVQFVGQLPAGAAIRAVLDEADLFVLPSRTEGLPRVLLEAMARGLPCISTNVGGIPELLGDDELVPVGDAAALAQAILDLGHAPQRMTRLAEQNLETARSYHIDQLRARRQPFYETVRARTAAMLAEARAE